MESGPACRKALWISFRRLMRIFSASRNRRCRKASWNWRLLAIISTGITQRRKGIQEPPYSQSKNPYPYLTELESKSMTRKAA